MIVLVNVSLVNTFLAQSNAIILQNRIRSVDPGTFSGLQHLRVLYLDDNDLAEVNLKIGQIKTN